MGKIRELLAKLNYTPDKIVPVKRPDIDLVFLEMAISAAKRSPDGQTKHGCVIVNPEYRVLSTGYNGYPRRINYSDLPNTRPEKYPWFLHAERNALAWCEKRPIGCSAYVTGEPCNDCLFALWQHGINKVVYIDGYSAQSNLTEKHRLIQELFVEKTGIILVPTKFEDSTLPQHQTGV